MNWAQRSLVHYHLVDQFQRLVYVRGVNCDMTLIAEYDNEIMLDLLRCSVTLCLVRYLKLLLVVLQQHDIVWNYVQMFFEQHWTVQEVKHISRYLVMLVQGVLVYYDVLG